MIRLSVWLVSGYQHVFFTSSVVNVTLDATGLQATGDPAQMYMLLRCALTVITIVISSSVIMHFYKSN